MVPLVTDAVGNVFSIMRQDNPTSTANNIVPFDQAEFVPFLNLYGFYEIRGMKAEMTVSDSSRCVGSGLYAGIAPNLVFPASTPNNVDLVKLPLQTKGNVQGQVFSIYYAYSDDLKKQGAQFALSTVAPVPTTSNGVIFARMDLAASPGPNQKVGEVKYTWYIRMTSRRYTA